MNEEDKILGDLFPKTTYSVDDILNELKLKSGTVSANTTPAPTPTPSVPTIKPASPVEKSQDTPTKLPSQTEDKVKSFFNKSIEQKYTTNTEEAKEKIDKLFEPVIEKNEKAVAEPPSTPGKTFGMGGVNKRAPHALTADEVLGVAPVPAHTQIEKPTHESKPFEENGKPTMRTSEFNIDFLKLKKNIPPPITEREIVPVAENSAESIIPPPVVGFAHFDEPETTKRAIKGFVVSGDEEENTPDETIDLDEDEELEEIDDYTCAEDAPSIHSDLDTRKRGLIARITISAIAAIVLLLLALVPTFSKLPSIIAPNQSPVTYLIVTAGIAFIALLINFRSVLGGFFSLLRFRSDLDTAVGVAMVFSIAHTVYMCWHPSYIKTGNLLVYPSIAVLALVFNNIGKLCMIARIKRNFQLVGNANIKKSVFPVYDDTANNMAKGLVLGDPVVCCDRSVVNLHNFLDHSFCEDPADHMCQTLAPIGFVVALLSAVLIGFITSDIPDAITSFTAILCVCIPITSLLASNFPLNNTAKRLNEMGTVLSGYDAVDVFCDTSILAIDAEELFPPGSVDLVSIKTSGIMAIDEAILDAAAVAIYAGGPLSDVFDKVIEGRRKMLPRVDSLFYEDDKGINGKVSGREVRIGNRRLMETHGILGLPDIEYERRMVREGNSTVYLSSGDSLAAMFVVRYHPDEDVAYELYKLIRRGVTLLIKTSDANITAEKLSHLFELPIDGIKIMPASSVNAYEKLTVPNECGDSLISHNNSLPGFAAAISACIFLRGNILFATVLQTIGVILGFATALFLAVTGQYTTLSVLYIVAYQLFFAALVLFLPSLRRP